VPFQNDELEATGHLVLFQTALFEEQIGQSDRCGVFLPPRRGWTAVNFKVCRLIV